MKEKAFIKIDECGVCLRARVLVLTHCGHYLCSTCKILTKVHSADQVFRCPFCRSEEPPPPPPPPRSRFLRIFGCYGFAKIYDSRGIW